MNLDVIAADLGVSVREGVLPFGWWGAYDHKVHTITLLPGLSPIQYKSTFAHELGHAFFRHQTTTMRIEREASIWAARQIISPPALLEAAFSSNIAVGIAAILEVMPADVESYVSAMSEFELQQVIEALGNVKSC